MRTLVMAEGLRKVFRFGLIGCVATATYFITATSAVYIAGATASEANVLASIIGIIASYTGHNYYTFRVSGSHGFYLPRFVITTAVRFAAALF